MADFWNDVRADVLNRLHQHAPTMPFEMKVMIAEDAARTAESFATPGPDGLWPLDPHPTPDVERGGRG